MVGVGALRGAREGMTWPTTRGEGRSRGCCPRPSALLARVVRD